MTRKIKVQAREKTLSVAPPVAGHLIIDPCRGAEPRIFPLFTLFSLGLIGLNHLSSEFRLLFTPNWNEIGMKLEIMSFTPQSDVLPTRPNSS